MAGLSSSSFDEFYSQLQTTALKATRNSMLLPSDVAFHRSMDGEFSRDLDGFSMRVLDVANRMLGLVGGSESNGKGKARAKLESEEDVVDNFHSLVVDSMDQLLEKTDMNLDEFLGRNKAPAIAINPNTRNPKSGNNHLEPIVQHAAHLLKPQLSFKRTIDNSDSPWYPTLSHKYNAQVPLGYHLHDEDENEDVEGESAKLIKLHPYRYEIAHLKYPSHLFSQSTPIPPQPFSATRPRWVSTASELQAMIAALVHSNSKPTEIAVDLEHHSYRSYRGFLCLMQLSTREQDWVVDLCVPEVREECEALNEVFTDPEIVKVFHGAESDIVWLQQDFNIYVVNLFDTFHASKVLGFPRHGLANLLEMYCDFTPDKRYQLADWRIRPLPEPMLNYARSDTHFLLYIYDNLRNALLDRSRSTTPSNTPPPNPLPSSLSEDQGHDETSLVKEVLKRSAETSLRVYEKEMYDSEGGTGSGGWDSLARKWNKVNLMADYIPPSVGGATAGLPRAVFKAVHAWRDRISREEDESTRFILPNHHLFTIAESPPADVAALLRLFPGTNVPQVIRKRATELVSVIRNAVKGCLGETPSGQKQTKEQEPRLEREKGNGGKKDVRSMDVDTSTVRDEGRLWNLTSGPPSTVTSKSSLFGASVLSSTSRSGSNSASLSTSGSKNIATSASVLFGSISTTKSTTSKAQQSETPRRFEEVVAKIHSTLVIGASVPIARPVGKISTTITDTTATLTATAGHDSEEENETLSSKIQVELPFIPASQRASSSKSAVAIQDDTIVVVGQARRKKENKRKRDKVKLDEDEIESGEAVNGQEANEDEVSRPKTKRSKKTPKKETSSDEQELGTFDFSSTPNILDAVPTTAQDIQPGIGRKKKDNKKDKEKKGSSMFYGDFPAPPKAHSELKSGNIAHTFK
ncbi:exosome nuclease subunit [Stygiomarasmius scandens]|uniref:Exosome nuclease subunit n=1 Tax=Marasmiellus scandens TaxID=2682957 RepID=A0ABR1JNU3_9AGAR